MRTVTNCAGGCCESPDIIPTLQTDANETIAHNTALTADGSPYNLVTHHSMQTLVLVTLLSSVLCSMNQGQVKSFDKRKREVLSMPLPGPATVCSAVTSASLLVQSLA